VVGMFGLGTIVLGLTQDYLTAFVALAVLGASDSVSVFIRLTLVPLATPESMRGRVLAVENVFIGASNELGAFESGVAAHLVGLVGAVVLGGAATLVVVILWWARFPSLRNVDRFDEVRPRPPPPASAPPPPTVQVPGPAR
jgi:MFS family permease